jgi:hypothetical protein
MPVLDPETINRFAVPVIETVLQAGIEPNECVVRGGGALALHGVRPAGHDVDLVVHPEVFTRLVESRQLANGVALRWKHPGREDARLISKQAINDHGLAVDIMSFLDLPGDQPLKAFEWYFDIAESYPHLSGFVYYASLTQVKTEKSSSIRPKDRLDLRRIRKHTETVSSASI